MSKVIRILYIEDDEPTKELTLELIKDLTNPTEIHSYHNYKEALTALQESDYDFIIADANVEDFQLFEELDKLAGGPKIIILSGMSTEYLQNLFMQSSNILTFINKDIGMDYLRIILSRALTNTQLLSATYN